MGKQGDVSTANGCKSTNRHGEPCGGYALPGSDYCFAHDPDRAAERKAARRKGGRARHGRTLTWGDEQLRPPVQIRSVQDVLSLLERAAGATMQLENSNQRNRTLAQICEKALKALEVGELEERLNRLEKHVEESE